MISGSEYVSKYWHWLKLDVQKKKSYFFVMCYNTDAFIEMHYLQSAMINLLVRLID